MNATRFSVVFSLASLVATPVAAGDPPSPCSTGNCVQPPAPPSGCGGSTWCISAGTAGEGTFFGSSYAEANASGFDTATLAESNGDLRLRQRVLDPLAGQSWIDLGARGQSIATRVETEGRPNQTWAGFAGSGNWNYSDRQRGWGSFDVPTNLPGILNRGAPAAQ